VPAAAPATLTATAPTAVLIPKGVASDGVCWNTFGDVASIGTDIIEPRLGGSGARTAAHP
jgi:hypothetical protein